jgi:peptidoglycan/xylan/chitin deacetylase (PgdA/CDA1 family)
LIPDVEERQVTRKTTADEPNRDYVGYGARPPEFEWPGGARLAVNVVVNYEEGSERNPLEGDTEPEPLVEARYSVAPGERDLAMESSYEFGSRVGVWRVLALLDEFGIRPTIFGCGMAFERNPAAVAAFVERGCDFVGHGYRWIPHGRMSVAEQAEDIRRCVAVLERETGRPVRGWFGRAPQTTDTRRLLAEQGLLYDSGAVNDEIPYFTPVAGRPFLVVPYSLEVNDIRYWKGEFTTASDFADYARDSFDTLYDAPAARMLSIGLHPRVIGRPGRLPGLRALLTHIASRPGVWLAGRDEIAQFWAERFAPENAWNLPG